jgi:hypothetical protein
MIQSDYFEDGVCVINNLITKKNAEQLQKQITEYSSRNGEDANKIFTYPISAFSFFDPRVYLRHKFNPAGTKVAINLLILLRKSKFQDAKKKLDLGSCGRIDSYLSCVSNNDIIKWHCDQSYGGATDPGIYFNGTREKIPTIPVNKCFLNLTDVSYANGALNYLPKSHKIGVAIRQAFNSGVLQYRPFLSLEDAMSIISENIEVFLRQSLLSEEQIIFFLEKSRFALDNKDCFSMNVDAGSMVIFNDLGYHKGSAPKTSQRAVVRYFY